MRTMRKPNPTSLKDYEDEIIGFLVNEKDIQSPVHARLVQTVELKLSKKIEAVFEINPDTEQSKILYVYIYSDKLKYDLNLIKDYVLTQSKDDLCVVKITPNFKDSIEFKTKITLTSDLKFVKIVRICTLDWDTCLFTVKEQMYSVSQFSTEQLEADPIPVFVLTFKATQLPNMDDLSTIDTNYSEQTFGILSTDVKSLALGSDARLIIRDGYVIDHNFLRNNDYRHLS